MDFGLLTLEMRGINTVFKIQAMETCNTVMEEKFCDNMQSVRFWGFLPGREWFILSNPYKY